MPPIVSYEFLLHPYSGLVQDWEQFFYYLYPNPQGDHRRPTAHPKNQIYADDTHPSDVHIGEMEEFQVQNIFYDYPVPSSELFADQWVIWGQGAPGTCYRMTNPAVIVGCTCHETCGLCWDEYGYGAPYYYYDFFEQYAAYFNYGGETYFPGVTWEDSDEPYFPDNAWECLTCKNGLPVIPNDPVSYAANGFGTGTCPELSDDAVDPDDYLVLTPTFGTMVDYTAEAATDNLHGYSKCLIIGACPAGAVEGSACEGGSSPGTNGAGFCFVNHEGDMLCGRTALWWSFGTQYGSGPLGEAPFDVRRLVSTPLACSPHTHATTDLSGPWQPRLLVGGCMISGDQYNTGYEEVHLPHACQFKAHLFETGEEACTGLSQDECSALPCCEFESGSCQSALAPGATCDAKVGCMDKGALNYKPTARENAQYAAHGRCKYTLQGCTDSAALNYNSEASEDDGSCEYGECGCGVAGQTRGSAYAGVHPSTDKYQELFVGVPKHPSGSIAGGEHGLVTFEDYRGVMAYTETADVLGGRTCGNAMGSECEFVIEGCMDPSAHNYDSRANKNSNTWCVPVVPGCMMPSVAEATVSTSLYNTRFGLALSFNGAATTHRPAACSLQIKGCMDAEAANYDSHATENYGCIGTLIGCLNPKALNYDCTTLGVSSCTEGVTVHSAAICVFYDPEVIPSGEGASALTITLTATGDVSDVTDADKTAIAEVVADSITGLSASDITVTVAAGSVVFTITVNEELDAAQMEEFEAFEAYALSSPEAAQGILDAAQLTGFTVETVSVAIDVIPAPPPSPPPSSSSDAGMIGGIIGGMSGCIFGVFFGGMYYRNKKKASVTAPA